MISKYNCEYFSIDDMNIVGVRNSNFILYEQAAPHIVNLANK